MYIEFLFVGNMQCGYKELRLLRTFSCGYLGLLYPELTVHYRCGVYVVFADMHDIYV